MEFPDVQIRAVGLPDLRGEETGGRLIVARLCITRVRPGGLVLAASQIAAALADHPVEVTAVVPHYAMSGGTLIALAADRIVTDLHALGLQVEIGVRDKERELLALIRSPGDAKPLSSIPSERPKRPPRPGVPIALQAAGARGREPR